MEAPALEPGRRGRSSGRFATCQFRGQKRGEVVGIIGQQRRRQVHAAEGPLPHHRADHRAHHPAGPDREPARGRDRIPPRPQRQRQHLPERRHPRAHPGRDKPQVRSRSWSSPTSTRFLDTPVKRYSSGMYVRLAFAVAAHLEPDTLDRRRGPGGRATRPSRRSASARSARSRAQEGSTVLFVSHNLSSVRQLCTPRHAPGPGPQSPLTGPERRHLRPTPSATRPRPPTSTSPATAPPA
jgi:hypothetical protein